MMSIKSLSRGTMAGSGFLALCLVLIWPACSMAQDKHIEVTVQQVGAVYKLVFESSECPDRPNEHGCVMADHGVSPNLSWQLIDSGTGDWVFSRLRFSPDGVHWGDPGYPLTNCTMEAFDVDAANRVSGWAPAQVVANGAMLKIHDHNKIPCITHYRLYAQPRAGGAEIDSDPIIDNRGGGPN